MAVVSELCSPPIVVREEGFVNQLGVNEPKICL
jgi:hypothetical protein